MNSELHPRGFTLLEILLVISLIAALAAISVPVNQGWQQKNDLDIAVNTFVQNSRRAQTLAQGMASDTSWGVLVATSTLVLFQGASYAARASSTDEITDFGSDISVSGAAEIVFAKFTGFPAAATTTTLSISADETHTITINR